MPAAILSQDEWKDIRTVVESGISVKAAADQYGLDQYTVWKRAQREGWLTPSKLEKAVQRQREVSKRVQDRPPPAEIIAKSMAEQGEELRSLALKLSKKGLKDALSNPDLRVESWDDAKKAWEIGAKAAGLDKGEGASVTVLFGAPPAETTFQEPDEAQEAEIVDADVIDADE